MALLSLGAPALLGCTVGTGGGSAGSSGGKALGATAGTWGVAQLVTAADNNHRDLVGRTVTADYVFAAGCDGSKSSACRLDVTPGNGNAFSMSVTRAGDGFYTGTVAVSEGCYTRDGSHILIKDGFTTTRSVKVGRSADGKSLVGALHQSSLPVGVAADASFGCFAESVDFQLNGTAAAAAPAPDEPSTADPTPVPAPVPPPEAARECSDGTDRQWSYHVRVSEDDGLVLDMARLGVRQAVRAIQVPYLEIQTAEDGVEATHRVELTPSVADPTKPGAALKTLSCSQREAAATYTISGLPNGVQMSVTQRYTFADLVKNAHCEPSGSIPCARFWPSVEWAATGLGSGTDLKSVRTVQRMDWWPDNVPNGKADVFRDGPPELSEHDHLAINRADTDSETTLRAIDTKVHGCDLKGYRLPRVPGFKDVCPWDNYHHGPDESIAKPGLFGSPACPSCVHFHWGWSPLTNRRQGGFTSGRPAVLRGSPQKAWISLVKENLDRPQEEEPVSVRSLIADHQSLEGRHPITYWETSSSGIRDQDGSRHDAAIPVLTGNKDGDQGSFWFSPAVPTDNFSRIDKPHPEHDARWGELVEGSQGWVLPVTVSFAGQGSPQQVYCSDTRGTGIRGPVYLQVDAPQELLNAEESYRLSDAGLPYVQLRTDELLPSGEVRAGDAVPELCQDDDVTAYLVFKDRPTPGDVNLSILVSPSTTALKAQSKLPPGLR